MANRGPQSPQASLQDAAKVVLSALSNIRKTPELRRSFVSGSSNAALEAIGEVHNIFQPKGKTPTKKVTGEKAKKKRKKRYFKHVIGCFSAPDATTNPSRQGWDDLYSIGLGKLWKGRTEACIPEALTVKEFHALLVSMFPALFSSPYDLCKLGGPYNNEVKVIEKEDSTSGSTFVPCWSPEDLRSFIGKKAQLLIRPKCCIQEKTEGSKGLKVKEGEVICVFCKTSVNVCEWDSHFCRGMEDYTDSKRPLPPTLSEVVDSMSRSSSMSPNESDDEDLPRVSFTRKRLSPLTVAPQNAAISAGAGMSEVDSSKSADDELVEVVGGATVCEAGNERSIDDVGTSSDEVMGTGGSFTEFIDLTDTATGSNNAEYEEWKKIREEQDRAFLESLQADQKKELQARKCQELEEERRQEAARADKWRAEIRADLERIVPLEADPRSGCSLKVKFRFPNGDQVLRWFSPLTTIEQLKAFIGSNPSVENPREFIIKVANTFPPKELNFPDSSRTLEGLKFPKMSILFIENKAFVAAVDTPEVVQSTATTEAGPEVATTEAGPEVATTEAGPEVAQSTATTEAGPEVAQSSVATEVAPKVTENVSLLEHEPQILDVLDVAADVSITAVTQVGAQDFSTCRTSVCARLLSKPPHTIVVNRNNVEQILMKEYETSNLLLATSLSIKFEGESADDLSGLTRETFSIFFKSIQEKYFDGNIACAPRVDPQTCQCLTHTDDTLFTTIGKIISHCYVLTKMFPLFIARASLQSVLLTAPVTDDILVSSFLEYVDEFEKDAIKSIMSGPADAAVDDDVLENVVAVFSRCQFSRLPSRSNIYELVSSVAMSELVCRPTHALQALHKGLLAAHPEVWNAITIKDIDVLYEDLIPKPRNVWKLISPVNETMTRQEEKVFDFLRRFVLSLNSQLLGLFLRFITGSSYAGIAIKVDFNTQEAGFQRRPTVNTCTSHLHLSTSYITLTEFKTEFVNILNHCDKWYMDMQ